MSRNRLSLELALLVVVVGGVVLGNFVLNRWVLNSSASREASAGTSPAAGLENWDEFAPRRHDANVEFRPRDLSAHRDRLKQLIQEKLPQADEDEVAAWCEELADLSLPVAEGILDLKAQLNAAARTLPASSAADRPSTP